MRSRQLQCIAIMLTMVAPASSILFAQTEASLADFRKGTDALQHHELDQAVADFLQVTRESPRFAEAYLNLGLAYAQQGKNEPAVQALGKAVTIKPALHGAHLFLAISEYKLNRLEPAAVAIRKETALSPGDANAWLWQGIIELEQKRLSEAVESLDKAATLNPGNVDIFYHRGRAALALSRQSYEQMFKLDPNSWHVHQVLAQGDVESDHDADAVEQYKLAIAAGPPQSGLHVALGSSLWRLGKLDEAQAEFEIALKIDPDDSLGMYKLGCLYVDRSKAAEAKPLLEKVLAWDPSLAMTKYYLGRADIALGQDREAVQYFKDSITANLDAETTQQAWFQLSRVYRRLHDVAASNDAAAQYRMLEQKTRTAQEQKLSQRNINGDRDTSIPHSQDAGEQ